ncbi:MAG TPA: DUF4339 domain-containing protein, partial [Polyangiaceae bacterium]
MVAASSTGPNSASPPDVWHVLMAPGETKILSLEQLDDFFRLEVIDGSTKVWQPGMTEWLPLSVVAGLGGDEDIDDLEEIEPEPSVVASIPAPAPPSARAATPSRRAPSPPRPPSHRPTPPSVAAPVVAVSPWPSASVPAAPASLPAPAPVLFAHGGPTTVPPFRPAPESFFPPAVPATAPAYPHFEAAPVSAFPPAARPVAPLTAAPAPVRSVAPNPGPESTRPFVLGTPSFVPPPQGSRAGGWLLGLAAMVALGFTLFRNDVLRDVAKTAGQETAYLRLEQTLGSPGFGTPRAVAHLSELTPLEAVLPPAPRLETQPVVEAPSKTAEPASATHSEAAPSPAPA